MNREELEHKLTNLKSDYARIQGDLEKMEAIVGNSASAEHQLVQLETEIKELRKQIRQTS